MNNIRFLFFSLFLVGCISSCGADFERSLLFHIDNIAETTYFDDDPLETNDFEINGVWKARSRTYTGSAGTSILSNDFDHLLIKPNGIFGIVKKDRLITTGKIEIENEVALRIKFIPEDDDLNISILNDSLLIPDLENNKLDFWYGMEGSHFERIE